LASGASNAERRCDVFLIALNFGLENILLPEAQGATIVLSTHMDRLGQSDSTLRRDECLILSMY
jgi:hypothetical protein